MRRRARAAANFSRARRVVFFVASAAVPSEWRTDLPRCLDCSPSDGRRGTDPPDAFASSFIVPARRSRTFFVSSTSATRVGAAPPAAGAHAPLLAAAAGAGATLAVILF